jgi:hypothetical protein
MTVTASTRLRGVLDLVMPPVGAASARLWNHPRLDVLYPRYLVCLHTVIRSSVPLMVAARDAARDDLRRRAASGDQDAASSVSRQLAAYLDQHIPEETGHDDWLLDDLARIGVPPRDALDHIPAPSVAGLVGAQYYYISHYRPVALLGYIGLLEGYPPTEEMARSAASRTGYPIDAFRTLRKHANLDPHHRDDLDRCLDAMPLEPGDMTLITTNAMASAERLAIMLDELVTEHPVTLLPARVRGAA